MTLATWNCVGKFFCSAELSLSQRYSVRFWGEVAPDLPSMQWQHFNSLAKTLRQKLVSCVVTTIRSVPCTPLVENSAVDDKDFTTQVLVSTPHLTFVLDFILLRLQTTTYVSYSTRFAMVFVFEHVQGQACLSLSVSLSLSLFPSLSLSTHIYIYISLSLYPSLSLSLCEAGSSELIQGCNDAISRKYVAQLDLAVKIRSRHFTCHGQQNPSVSCGLGSSRIHFIFNEGKGIGSGLLIRVLWTPLFLITHVWYWSKRERCVYMPIYIYIDSPVSTYKETPNLFPKGFCSRNHQSSGLQSLIIYCCLKQAKQVFFHFNPFICSCFKKNIYIHMYIYISIYIYICVWRRPRQLPSKCLF